MRCSRDASSGVGWFPEKHHRDVGTRASLIHVRDTMLRGVVDRTK